MRATLILCCVLGLMLALPSFGQTAGAITGVVTDSTGAVVAGASVTISNPQTNFSRVVISNATGNFNVPELQPGVYTVRAEMQGFQAEVRTGLELQVQQTARVDFHLNVGSVTETLEVAGGTPLLNTENASVGTVIDNKRIDDLPLNGREFTSLIALSPNVVSGQTSTGGFASTRMGGDRANLSISVGGMRREFTYYTLDGLSNTDQNWNTYSLLPSIDALQEFKVQEGIYSAEFGHEAVQVNISTKGGTNDYHGSVFEFLRNNDLDARPFGFTAKEPTSSPFKWNQYGFTLGGPIRIPKLFNGKDRLFFMSNFEGFKLRNQTQTVDSVPTAAMQAGNFSQAPVVITDPLSGNTPFPNNVIPQQRFNPIAAGLLQYYATPNIPGTGLVLNYLQLDSNSTNKDQFTQRIDWAESSKSSWFGRYSWENESLVTPGLNQAGQAITLNVQQAMISNVYVFAPNWVNEARAGYAGFSNDLGALLAFKKDPIADLHIPVLLDPSPNGWGIPPVGINGFTGFGDSAQGPFVNNDHTFSGVDSLSWTHGSHAIKIGAEVSRLRYNEFGNQQTRGGFTIGNQATGYGPSDYLLGYLSASADTGALAIGQYRQTTQAYYIDDTWKVRSNLTIEVGVRYEYWPPFTSKSDTVFTYRFPAGFAPPYTYTSANQPTSLSPIAVRNCAAGSSFYPANSIIRLAPQIPTECDPNLGNTLGVFPDKDNFAPRLGIAWSPAPNWTVHLGAGIFYVQNEANPVFDVSRNQAGRVSDTANVKTHDLTFSSPFTFGSTTCGVPSPPYICITNPITFTMNPHDPTAYVEQYTLNIQRQLTGATVLEAGYLGSQGHRLREKIFGNNALPRATGSSSSNSPFPYLSYDDYTTGVVNSNYNSGYLKLTRRLSKGLSLLAGYTFSKSIDDGDGPNPANGQGLREPQTGSCFSCNRGLSDFNASQRFVVSGLYQLPFGKGQPFLNHGFASHILGGWQVNSILTKSTGFPVRISDGINQSNSNANMDLPNASGQPTNLSNPTTGEWFNIESVVLQPFGTYGNLGRNTVTSPGILSWDFSTLKNFYFTEQRYLQFRFECFNCANHPNFADPASVLSADQLTSTGYAIPGSGAFGQITNTRTGIDMRELQFSLKLLF